MCIAETSTMPSRTPLLLTICSTCGVMWTYARWVLVWNFRYSVSVFMPILWDRSAQCRGDFSAFKQFRDACQVGIHDAIFLHRRAHRADRRMHHLAAF